MKNIIKFSILISTSILTLNAATFTNPLGSAFKSTDNGGTLPAIDAYKDGVGVIVLDNLGQNIQIDNSAMNTLVYKYGETAKTNNVTVSNEVLHGSGSTNVKDKELAININNIVSGNIVDSTNVNGTACNDNNGATVGETWLNGNCQGGMIGVNIASNGLLYDNCESGSMSFVDSVNYCASKGMRLPTIDEIYPSGGLINSCPTDWTWTSTANTVAGSYYVWIGGSIDYSGNVYPSTMVRCVK